MSVPRERPGATQTGSRAADGIRLGGPPPELVDTRMPCAVAGKAGARLLVLPTAGRRPTAAQRKGPVSLQLWVLAGTSAERPAEHGCAHLLEHMLFKPAAVVGTDRVHDITSGIEALGGDVNAYTSHDETVFHATVPGTQVAAGIEALAGPVVAPTFDPLELQREARVVIEEIKQYDDDPHSSASQALIELLYGDHSYARPVLGRRREILGHTADVLAGFHRRNYAADRTVLIVVGPVNPTTVRRKAAQVLGGLAPGGRRRRTAVEPPRPPDRARVRITRDDVHEGHLVVGWQAPPLLELAGCAIEVASVVLGYGEASRLASETRRRERLVTDVHGSLFASRDACTLVVSATTPPDRVEPALRGVMQQIDRLRRIPMDEDELARARAVLEADVVYRRETVQGQAHALGSQLSLVGDLFAEQRYFDLLAELTPETVRDACAEHLLPQRAAVSIVVPRAERTKQDVVELRKALRSQLRAAKAKTRRGPAQPRRDAHGLLVVDLPSGIRIRAAVDSSVPMAAGWLVWPGGLRREQTRDLGASPLMAALLTRGSTERDGDTLAREIDAMAAMLEGFSGRNSLGMHFECLAPDTTTVLRRALECVSSPSFSEEELAEERRVALEELAGEQDDLGVLAFRAAYAELYRGHPFRHRRRGTVASLERLTSARLRTLWQRNYTPRDLVLGLAGDIDVEALVDLVDAMIGDAPRRKATPQWPGGPPRYPARPRVRKSIRPREQAHLVLAHPGLTLDDPALPALELLTTIVGGQTGRLFDVLRERQGLVYHVSASSSEGIDAGHVAIYAATSQQNLDRALAAVEAELATIVERQVSCAELDRAKAWLVGQFEASMQRRSRIASQMAFDEAYGLGHAAHRSWPEEIMAVDAKGVRALAQRVFDPKRRVTSIVSA